MSAAAEVGRSFQRCTSLPLPTGEANLTGKHAIPVLGVRECVLVRKAYAKGMEYSTCV